MLINLDNIKFYSIVLVVATIPLPMLVNNVSIFFSLLLTIIVCLKERKKFMFNTLQVLFVMLFITSLLSIIYAPSFILGIKGIEKYLSFLIFPIIFANTTLDSKKVNIIKYTFIVSISLVFLFSILMAIIHTIQSGSAFIFNPENYVLENRFKYHRLMSSVNLSATIFAIYLVFAISLTIYDFLKSYKHNKRDKYLQIFILILLSTALLLMNSFTAYFALSVILISILLHINGVKRYYLLAIVPILASILIFNSKAKGISKSVFEYNLTDDVHNKNWNSLNVRLAKWECALEVIRENFPFGTGIGYAQTILNEKYLEKDFEVAYNKKFSTHNQYLHYLVESGLSSFVVFLVLLSFGLYKSIVDKNFTLNTIMLLLIIASLTDNVLIVNKGIVFFVLFACFASKTPIINKNEKVDIN